MAIKAGGWSILGSFFDKALMLSTYVVVSRSADPEYFGYAVGVLLFIELLTYIGGFGVAENIIRKDSVDHDFLTESFIFLRRIAAVCVVFMLVVATPLSYFLVDVELAKLVLVISFYPLLTIFSGFYVSILQRRMQFKQVAFRTIIISFVGGSFGLGLALTGWGVLSLFIAKYVYSILDIFLLRKLTGFSPTGRSEGIEYKSFFSYGWKISVAQVFNFFNSRIYEVFVAIIFGPAALAVFDIGRKFLMTLYRIILTPLNRVVLSFVSRSDNKIQSYTSLVSIASAIVIPVVAIMSAMSDDLVTLFFGSEWSESVVVMEALSYAAIVQMVAWFLPSLLISKGHSSSVLITQILSFLIQLLFAVAGYWFAYGFADYVYLLVFSIYLSVFARLFYLHSFLNIPVASLILVVVLNSVLFFVAKEYCNLVLLWVDLYPALSESIILKVLSLMAVGASALVMLIPYYYVVYVRYKKLNVAYKGVA